ncbi:MAG: hypothetical protein K2J32_14760, partial [Ruminococcus sp.]|nr:hypothetical protein [Ruminococcus sp.]
KSLLSVLLLICRWAFYVCLTDFFCRTHVNKYLENFDYCRSVWKKYQDNIRVSEMLKTEIQKSHDIYDIAVTAVRAVGLMTHDESFIKTNTAKLEALK